MLNQVPVMLLLDFVLKVEYSPVRVFTMYNTLFNNPLISPMHANTLNMYLTADHFTTRMFANLYTNNILLNTTTTNTTDEKNRRTIRSLGSPNETVLFVHVISTEHQPETLSEGQLRFLRRYLNHSALLGHLNTAFNVDLNHHVNV